MSPRELAHKLNIVSLALSLAGSSDWERFSDLHRGILFAAFADNSTDLEVLCQLGERALAYAERQYPAIYREFVLEAEVEPSL